jgi:hypothetical protein
MQPFLEAGPQEIATQVGGARLGACSACGNIASAMSVLRRPTPADTTCTCTPPPATRPRHQCTPLERAQLQLCLAQAAMGLFQLHARLDAANLDSHPVQKELVSCVLCARTGRVLLCWCVAVLVCCCVGVLLRRACEAGAAAAAGACGHDA